ncbi:hypothetical protein WAI453_011489 [Rhynchosporium graminicola]
MHFVPTILILLSAVAATQAVAARDMRIIMNMPAPFEGNDDPAKTNCDSAGGKKPSLCACVPDISERLG